MLHPLPAQNSLDLVRRREQDAVGDERGAGDEGPRGAVAPLEDAAHVRPLAEPRPGGGPVQAHHAHGDAAHVVNSAGRTEKRGQYRVVYIIMERALLTYNGNITRTSHSQGF